jgi:hypothetical protein
MGGVVSMLVYGTMESCVMRLEVKNPG